jgi:hypothetical protein
LSATRRDEPRFLAHGYLGQELRRVRAVAITHADHETLAFWRFTTSARVSSPVSAMLENATGGTAAGSAPAPRSALINVRLFAVASAFTMLSFSKLHGVCREVPASWCRCRPQPIGGVRRGVDLEAVAGVVVGVEQRKHAQQVG